MGCLKLAYYENPLVEKTAQGKCEAVKKVVQIFTSVDPLADTKPWISPYAYCLNNPLRYIDPDGRDEWDMTTTGHVTWIRKSETHQLFALDEKGNRTGNSITVTDRGLLDGLSQGRSDYKGNYGETSNSKDAFNVFKFAADNSSPEWSLKGYSSSKGATFLLATSHNDEGVPGLSGCFDPSKLLFNLHSHPVATDNIGPSGWITRAPNSSTAESNAGHSDLRSMMINQQESPNSKHYLYHEGTKKLIYYDINTAINKKTQNEQGRSMGVMNSASQMRRSIMGR